MVAESRIIHGDARTTPIESDKPITLICTDPPYGMAFKSGSARHSDSKKFTPEIANDADEYAAMELFHEVVDPLVEKCADDADMYVFCRWSMVGDWMMVVNAVEEFEVKNLLIWDKGIPGMGDTAANWGYSFECIIYAKKGRRPISNGRRSSIIAVDRVPGKKNFHPTQKPVKLLEELVLMSTDKGDLVVDPFAGSGSTILAAHNTGRVGIGIELNEEYARRGNELLTQGVFDLGLS